MDEITLDFEPIELPETESQPEVDETEVEQTQESDEVSGGDQSAPEGQDDDQPVDGRRVPDDVRKALKAFRDSSPENAKAARALNDSYGREQAYKAVFPSVKDAQAAQSTLQTLESFGGIDGVQQALNDIEEVDQLLQVGDPKAVDKILEVAGEGAGKIVPAMLDRLQTSNPEAYAAAIRPHLVTAIGASGLTEAFASVIQAYNIAQTPGATAEFKQKWEKDATEGLTKIHQYLQGLGKQPEKTQPVQQNDVFTKREQELSAREAQAFNNEVGNLANPKMNASLSKAITPYLRGVKLDPTARQEFVQAIYDESAKLAKADKVYQTQKDALYKSKTKDAANVAKHITGKFESIVGDAVKTVANRPQWKALLGTKGSAAAPGKQGQGAPVAGKPVLVKELPSRNDVDWEKTTDDMMIRGIRVLKSGKTVKLDR